MKYMKYKKLPALLIVILSVLAFSCASKPKAEDVSIEKQIEDDFSPEENQDIPQTEVESENLEKENIDEISEGLAEKNAEEQLTEDNAELQTEQQEEAEPADSELAEEKVEADILEDLPDLEEPSQPEEIPENEPVEEPVVQDEVEQQEEEEKTENQLGNEDSLEENESQDNDIEFGDSSENSNLETELEIEEENQTEENSTEDSEIEDTIEDNLIEENADSEIDSEESTEKEQTPVPSRSITIGKNQLIDISYPGKGWIYQGCLDSEGNIDSRNKYFIFGGRKLGGEDQCFTLRSRTPGKFLLHFFKNDGLTGDYIDDYLEVIVENKAVTNNDHIKVPSYAEIVPPKVSITKEKIEKQKKLEKMQKALEEEKAKAENSDNTGEADSQPQKDDKKNVDSSDSKAETAQKKQKKTADEKIIDMENSGDEPVGTVIQTSESAPNSLSPVADMTGKSTTSEKNTKSAKKQKEDEKNAENDFLGKNIDSLGEEDLLKTAQKLYDSKEFESALLVITKFFDKSSKNIDQGLYLQGQILEEKSSVQNIKDAIESYDLLVKNYPASKLWDKAKKRSIFLRRFYINIR